MSESTKEDLIYDSIFWLTLVTIVLASVRYFIKYGTRHCKCKTLKCCWGFFEGERDTKAEVDIETIRIENGIDNISDDSKEYKEPAISRT
jgi:hypothetical protein